MTLTEAQAKRDEILSSVGIARTADGERNVEYAKQQDALALIDAEIARLQAAAGTAAPRVSFVQHSRE